nr:alpha/beta hydrolase [Halovivax asiaticus]
MLAAPPHGADELMADSASDSRTGECTLSDGRTVAYTTSGDPDGLPVFVHHGSPGSRLFGSLVTDSAKAAGCRLVIPDRPGYGCSSPPPDGWTWSDWPADLDAVRRAESIDRAAHMGFSGGGPFAIATAAADWTTRIALVSTVVPPAENGLATVSKIPYGLRALFRLSSALASVSGPDRIVAQYTDRAVPDPVTQAVGADFHEALRQGTNAVARECRRFARESLDADGVDSPLRWWHGTADTNAAIEPVRTLADEVGADVVESDTDHLGVLLDQQRDIFEWLTADRRVSESG